MLQKRQGRPAISDEQGIITAALAEKLFADAEAAMPLSGLPVAHCAKSVSFGTSRYIWFRGEKSPDISCASRNEKVASLKYDFAKVMSAATFEHQP